MHVFAQQLEEYSNEAHLFAVMAAIWYSETILQSLDDEPPDYEPSDEEDEYSRLQNPTKTTISQKIFLERFLTVQLSTGRLKWKTTLNFAFVHVQIHPNHGGKKLLIDDYHGCKATAITPQELLRHLKMKVILLIDRNCDMLPLCLGDLLNHTT